MLFRFFVCFEFNKRAVTISGYGCLCFAPVIEDAYGAAGCDGVEAIAICVFCCEFVITFSLVGVIVVEQGDEVIVDIIISFGPGGKIDGCIVAGCGAVGEMIGEHFFEFVDLCIDLVVGGVVVADEVYH